MAGARAARGRERAAVPLTAGGRCPRAPAGVCRLHPWGRTGPPSAACSEVLPKLERGGCPRALSRPRRQREAVVNACTAHGAGGTDGEGGRRPPSTPSAGPSLPPGPEAGRPGTGSTVVIHQEAG